MDTGTSHVPTAGAIQNDASRKDDVLGRNKGKDVASSLEYENTRDALHKHVEPEDKKTYSELTKGVANRDAISNQQPHEVYINESGFYSLALRSKQPAAKSFKRWVTSEVLPSIRRQGYYGRGDVTERAVTELSAQVQALQTTVATLVAGVVAVKQEIGTVAEYGPRVEMSRSFPSPPDALLDIGIKLQEESDLQRLREYGLPVTTFLQEKFPEKRVSRISACFAKTLKQRRLALYREDPDEHRIFLMYPKSEWRIA